MNLKNLETLHISIFILITGDTITYAIYEVINKILIFLLFYGPHKDFLSSLEYLILQRINLKVVSATFLLLCFVCLTESTFEIRKCFLSHFESSFRSWDNQILTFMIFKYHDAIKWLSMKHKTLSLICWCNITKDFLLKNYIKNMIWTLAPDLLSSKASSVKRNLRRSVC